MNLAEERIQRFLATQTVVVLATVQADGAPLAHATGREGLRRFAAEGARFSELTERELEILRLLADGLSNAEIATRVFISEKTVRNHLVSIYAKLEVSDRLELAIYAGRHGLAHPPD